nr:helix-turn-helix domain-containing protein [Maribacter polysiphoniae]
MRKVKQIFKLYSEGVSKRRISSRLGLSRNTIIKYIAFFKRGLSTKKWTIRSANMFFS